VLRARAKPLPLLQRCPNGPPSKLEQDLWRGVFTPSIIARLESVDEPFGLDGSDIANFAHLCAFESLAFDTVSPFCGLFLPEEWEAIEYVLRRLIIVSLSLMYP
jgi:hypothetical protein